MSALSEKGKKSLAAQTTFSLNRVSHHALEQLVQTSAGEQAQTDV